MRRPSMLTTLSMVALSAASISATSAAWMAGKAIVAQHLLDVAWQASRHHGAPTRPWRWADVTTVGRLTISALDESLIVLSDASGEAMAFGPGLVAGDPLQADSATVAIGGHRDTHLAFMQNQKPGELILLEALDGKTYRYQLLDSQIVDTRSQSLSIATDFPGLVLITCYPFNARQTGGPLRMVVRAAYLPA